MQTQDRLCTIVFPLPNVQNGKLHDWKRNIGNCLAEKENWIRIQKQQGPMGSTYLIMSFYSKLLINRVWVGKNFVAIVTLSFNPLPYPINI